MPNSLRIYLKNADGTIKNDNLSECIKYNKDTRPTADFIDFNGDGLLDIAVTLHSTITKPGPNYIEIFLNTGTKEKPSFNNPTPTRVQALGKDISHTYMNFIFSDINNDSRPDMFLACLDSGEAQISYYMALNTSTTGSIVLGELLPLKYNGAPLKINVQPLQLSYGNAACLAYYDVNNDGLKELYINADTYQRYTSKPWIDGIIQSTKVGPPQYNFRITAGNMYFTLPFLVSDIALYSLHGKKITGAEYGGLTRTGRIPLYTVAAGYYVIRVTSSLKQSFFTISIIK